MNDSSRRQAITVSLALLVFAYREFRRLSAVADARDPTTHSAGSVLEDFGDVLRMHHCLSREPFSKDKFEYALERILIEAGEVASLAPRGQRGFDIEISTEKFSLKTEAAKAIRENTIHISKFMELGDQLLSLCRP